MKWLFPNRGKPRHWKAVEALKGLKALRVPELVDPEGSTVPPSQSNILSPLTYNSLDQGRTA